MKIRSQKAKLSGHIVVPGSKSHTIRALILAAMAEGVSYIKNPLPSNDCISTLNAIQKIGARLVEKKFDGSEEIWVIEGAGKKLHLPEGQIDVGNSGSLMYFLCPVLATLSGKCLFTGDESICTRPVGHLLDALIQFGAKAESIKNNNCPPFTFEGPIDISKKLITDGKLSQYISGFMMAASRTNGTLKMELKDPKETPYLTMTKMWLDSVGVYSSISPDFKNISVTGPAVIKGFERSIPSDWEGVAFPLIAALISGSKVTVDNIDFSGSQGDDKIVDVLTSVGAKITLDKTAGNLTVDGSGGAIASGAGNISSGSALETDGSIVSSGPAHLSTASLPGGKLQVNVSSFPDAICALCVIACYIEGTTILTDVEICRKKETDRVKAMCSILSSLGADIREDGDSIVIKGTMGGTNLHGGEVESYKDHRIAMSLSCLALGLKEGQSLVINDAECASVSFPQYFEKMNELGAGFTSLS
jgi:3-phosphoshikimate 1-carboxyvinyltransferase